MESKPADIDTNVTPCDDQEHLAQRLREAREYLGLSQEFVADQLQVPRPAIWAMETGKRKVSSLELKKLAQLYRRSYAYFLGEDDKGAHDDAEIRALYRATKELSAADKDQVLKYAQFLRQAGHGPRTARQDKEDSDG